MFRRGLTAAVAIVAAVCAGTAAAASVTPEQARYPVAPWMNRPCPNEGSVNCFWDARHRGNHRGLSFYVRHMPASNIVCVMYPARPLRDHCEALPT